MYDLLVVVTSMIIWSVVAGVSVYIERAHEGWIEQPPCRISRHVAEKDKDGEKTCVYTSLWDISSWA